MFLSKSPLGKSRDYVPLKPGRLFKVKQMEQQQQKQIKIK